jgi:teichuronic acid biosynthesis glycosyltransferase TuaG
MISILMPIYNGIEYINESVTSVLDQTYDSWELIIGINGHNPDSIVYNMAKNYEDLDQRIHVYDMHTIRGKSNALNAMLKHCNGDWIAILDVDDCYFNEKLSKQVPFMENYEIIGTKCVYFENLAGTIPQIPTGDITNFDFKKVNPIINSSCLIKKELAIKYGWDSSYDGIEDYKFWMTARKYNTKFYNVDEVLVKHRIWRNSAYNSKDNSGLLRKMLSEF